MARSDFAYTTLITRPCYLAGVIILGYTLKKYGSEYPLVVLYTDSLPKESVALLEAEAPHTNLILQRTDLLLPRDNIHVTLIAERFKDTWTKLRVFELFGYDKVCYLDADMMLRRNMDTIFDVKLPGPDWIAANHACVCNRDRDPWAPDEWRPENCAHTPLQHPSALTTPTAVTPDARPTYHFLNSGMFLYHPSRALWERMLLFFNTTELLGEWKFPDQDFLTHFFHNRWRSVGWQYNALKTMRYWHPNIWRDEEVVCLHYIVDKPWASRVKNGVAGFRGRDGETHTWWWKEYAAWVNERERQGEMKIPRGMVAHIAKAEEQAGEENPELAMVGGKVQAFAGNKPHTSRSDSAADTRMENVVGASLQERPKVRAGGPT